MPEELGVTQAPAGRPAAKSYNTMPVTLFQNASKTRVHVGEKITLMNVRVGGGAAPPNNGRVTMKLPPPKIGANGAILENS